MKVLDVACGTGNLSIPAAKLSADVTGLDIASNLIEQARARAAVEGLPATFDVGDAEALPYEDKSFDIVMSMFGAMFAPRPEITSREMKRVCKPGGAIAMANWTPNGFAAEVLKIAARYVTPPNEIPPPVLWGDEETVRKRLGEGTSDLRLNRRLIKFLYDVTPSEVVDNYIRYFGPTQTTFEALDLKGQSAFRGELVDLWTAHNQVTDGTTIVEAEYLEVIAKRAL
jgi:SAM-dependent methyltransferase